MREEMVAYRVRRVHQQLFRLLVCYQPGGSSDRALVLAQLDPKEGSNDVSEVATSLRRWFRWLQRAQDLQLSLPDPSVQIKALTSLTKKLADRNSDFQFKIALARTELRVDSRPNQDTALRYFQHLLAEVEQMGPTKAKASAHTATSSATAQALAVASDESSQRPRGGCYVRNYYHNGSKGSATSPGFLGFSDDSGSYGSSGSACVDYHSDFIYYNGAAAASRTRASHAYRKANDGDERERAHPVSVKLAEGETTLLQNEAGTLLGESTAETLVPLGQLVEVLGCSVRWTKNKLVVVHPVHGRLKVQVRDFCPELAEHEALRLIAELEEKRLRELNTAVQSLELKVAQSGRVMEWYEYVQDYVASGGRVDLLAAISKAPFFKDFPIERITTAAAIGVNVNVDLLDSTLFDVARMDGIYKLLLWAAAQGRIRNLVGGPPRRSYLAEDVNKRDKEEDLLARFLILGMVAFEGRRQRRSEKVGIAIEHPDYESSSGTFWQSSMWREFASCYGLEVIKSMRGSTGTNLDLGGLSNVASTTTSAGSWTEDYARCVAAAMNAWNGYPLGESVLCSVSVSEDGIKLGKMTAKEWQLHIRTVDIASSLRPDDPTERLLIVLHMSCLLM
ncbi:TSPEAR [Symbiodinium sp. KB8]|nr:TSPEAR [Symbiodinium sp. KB8]